MYRVLNARKTVSEHEGFDAAVNDFLKEVGSQPAHQDDILATKEVIKLCIDQYGAFGWGNIEIKEVK